MKDYHRVYNSMTSGNRRRSLPWFFKEMSEILGDQRTVKPVSVSDETTVKPVAVVDDQPTIKPVSIVDSLSGNYLIRCCVKLVSLW